MNKKEEFNFAKTENKALGQNRGSHPCCKLIRRKKNELKGLVHPQILSRLWRCNDIKITRLLWVFS